MGDRPSVLIVGGGAIGLCTTAYYLRRAGADVTLVDKNLCGSGASRGNAGRIVPSLSAPIPGPGLPLQTLRWLARADSPVHIRPASMSSSAVIHEHTCVRGFGRTAAKVTSVRTTVGELEADVVVLAAGAQTARLTKMVGHRVPMQPGKGYSFSIASQAPPRHALYLGDAKIGCSPLEGRTRIAGTMELPGDNVRLDMRRIDSMERSARQYLVEWPEGGATELWAGQRPLTPDGLPVIDRLGDLENTYVSTGHSTLGITLAPSSGLALCQYVLEGRRPPVLSPFAFDRF